MSTIPASDLPRVTPGAFDSVVGVDESTGAVRRFPLPSAGAPKAYATAADLPASAEEGTAAYVNNDPTVDNNGLWAYIGGAWVQSADRTTAIEVKLATLHEVAASDDEIAWVEIDENDVVLSYVTRSGRRRFVRPLERDQIEGMKLEQADIPGVSYVLLDETGTIVIEAAFTDGRLVSYRSGNRLSDLAAPEPEAETPGFPSAVMDGLSLSDFAYSWWCTAFEQVGKHLYIGGISNAVNGQYGEVCVAHALMGSPVFTKTALGLDEWMGSALVDDHDRLSLCADARPLAPLPIIGGQSAHGTAQSNVQLWKSPTIDPRHSGPRAIIGSGGQRTYNNFFRNPSDPDQVWCIGRYGNGGGVWVLLASDDSGRTWGVERQIFSSAEFAYPMLRAKSDRSGLLATWHVNPGSDGDRRIVALSLGWDGAVTNLAGGPIGNVLTGSPVDPYASGTVVHTPAGTGRARMTDLREVAPDVWQLVYLEGDGAGLSGGGVYLLTIDLTGAPAIGTPVLVTDAGETAAQTGGVIWHYSYHGGAAVIAQDRVVTCRYKPTSHPTQGIVELWDASGTPAVLAVLEAAGDYRPARPDVSRRVSWDGAYHDYGTGEWLSYVRFSRYDGFDSFDAQTRLINVKDYQ